MKYSVYFLGKGRKVKIGSGNWANRRKANQCGSPERQRLLLRLEFDSRHKMVEVDQGLRQMFETFRYPGPSKDWFYLKPIKPFIKLLSLNIDPVKPGRMSSWLAWNGMLHWLWSERYRRAGNTSFSKGWYPEYAEDMRIHYSSLAIEHQIISDHMNLYAAFSGDDKQWSPVQVELMALLASSGKNVS